MSDCIFAVMDEINNNNNNNNLSNYSHSSQIHVDDDSGITS
jgi:hypothetical protein